MNESANVWTQTPEQTWTIGLKVPKTEVINIGGYEYGTFVIDEQAESDQGMSFVSRKWYHPESGLILRSSKTWTGITTIGMLNYIKNSYLEKGEEEHYVLASVNYPKGTTTHALKGTKAGGAPDKALAAEVERLRRALAAKGQAGTGAAALSSALPAPDDIDFGRYHALVIGINDYEYLPKLQTAVDDAKGVANVLMTD